MTRVRFEGCHLSPVNTGHPHGNAFAQNTKELIGVCGRSWEVSTGVAKFRISDFGFRICHPPGLTIARVPMEGGIASNDIPFRSAKDHVNASEGGLKPILRACSEVGWALAHLQSHCHWQTAMAAGTAAPQSLRDRFLVGARVSRAGRACGGGAWLPSRSTSGKPLCGGGAIFNIVGRTNIDVGRVERANNVEGGSSRECRQDSRARNGINSSAEEKRGPPASATARSRTRPDRGGAGSRDRTRA